MIKMKELIKENLKVAEIKKGQIYEGKKWYLEKIY